MAIEECVPTTTLDRFAAVNEIGHIDVLKIDVEGHELDVLHGATEMLSSGRIDVVQFEFGGCNLDTRTNLHEFYSLMSAYGYVIHIITKHGLERIEHYREIYEQYRTTNFVAVRSAMKAGSA